MHDKQAIFDHIKAARQALRPGHPDAATTNTIVKPATAAQYETEAGRLFGRDPDTGEILHPQDPDHIIAAVRQAKTKATLRKRARSVRHVAMSSLNELLRKIDKAQRGGRWDLVERIVMHPIFLGYIRLAGMMPADYAQGWRPIRKRKGKKSSLLRLPANWREQMVATSRGQFRIPMLVALMTGCRPAELEKGILIEQRDRGVYVTIQGAKVTAKSGQEFRRFRLADHPLADTLMEIVNRSENPLRMIVEVPHGNSVSTHMRAIGQKLWPRRKETVTVYTARHAMAAECKAAIAAGADPDLVSQILGHIVDETASYYGNRFQSGGRSILPSEIAVPKFIRHKQRQRLAERKQHGKFPGRKSHRPTAP